MLSIIEDHELCQDYLILRTNSVESGARLLEALHAMPPREQQSRNTSRTTRFSRNSLQGSNISLFRRLIKSRETRRIRSKPTSTVEQLDDGLAPTVLYAPLIPSSEGETYVSTKLVSITPSAEDDSLVYDDMGYEIRTIGMFAKSFDRAASGNELILYSTQTDPSTPNQVHSLPFIHFDFSRDATTSSGKPNTFHTISASKSFVMDSSPNPAKSPSSQVRNVVQATDVKSNSITASTSRTGERTKTVSEKQRRSVTIQFRILEMERPSQTVQEAITGIKDLGVLVSSFGNSMPYLGVLNPALSIFSMLSKRALDSFAVPDKTISLDMDFLLANRNRVAKGTAPPGKYLRFGYYFFLAEPTRGKLYASVRTPENLTLMLKRSLETKAYFPLTDVSYLVVRVGEPTDMRQSTRRPLQMNHARILEDIFQRSKPGQDDPINIRDSLYDLGLSLGVFDFDNESPTR